MIYNGVTANEKDELQFDDRQLKVATIMRSFNERNRRLTKVQTRFRLCLARETITSIRNRKVKSVVLRTEFGMKIGKQYHLIKVLSETTKREAVFIKSDKATNQLEFVLDALGLEPEVDGYALRLRLKKHISKIMAFDPNKMLLINMQEKAKQRRKA